MNLFRKNKRAPAAMPAGARAEELSWETSRIALARSSERRAWYAAEIMGLVAITLAGAIALMMPLKEKAPYVIQVDRSTGLTTVLSVADGESVPASEMMDKYWLNLYVLAREGYDYHTLESDFVRVRELSTADSFEAYARQYGRGAGSLEEKYQDRQKIAVAVHSVIVNSEGVATVRFTKKYMNAVTEEVKEESSWSATVAYGYFPDYREAENLRLVNPLGFRVLSYRLDPEMH